MLLKVARYPQLIHQERVPIVQFISGSNEKYYGSGKKRLRFEQAKRKTENKSHSRDTERHKRYRVASRYMIKSEGFRNIATKFSID